MGSLSWYPVVAGLAACCVGSGAGLRGSEADFPSSVSVSAVTGSLSSSIGILIDSCPGRADRSRAKREASLRESDCRSVAGLKVSELLSSGSGV